MKDLTSLYRETIQRHASHPVGYRIDIEATHSHEEFNPQCGDRIELQFRLADNQIEAAAFAGEACAICRASASILCAAAPGMTCAEMRARRGDLEAMLKGETVEGLGEEMAALEGVRPYPSRIQCATLPWKAACKAMQKTDK